MSDTVIRVENISKVYRIASKKSTSIRDSFEDYWKYLFKKKKSTIQEEFWALEDINFEVKQGDIVGIVGRNGAGKSTLLKILSRITKPTTGRIEINGRVSSLLEVGTGFHPELSGRENIFLNGTILGMSRKEIKDKFDEIVEFSGVEKFIDTPVKHYSSGMYVRLAFAVAAHLEPEILIIDEVLAVGDAEFQKKCLGKMDQIAGQGRTILFVSHSMGSIKSLCSRAILLSQGQIAAQGDTQYITSVYMQGNVEHEGIFNVGKIHHNEVIVIEKVIFKNQHNTVTQNFYTGDDLIIELYCFTEEVIYKPYFWISVESQLGSCFAANSMIDGHCPSQVEGHFSIQCTFKSLPLVAHSFTVWAGIRQHDGTTGLTQSKEIGYFNIITNMKELGFNGTLAEAISVEFTPLMIPYKWVFGTNEIYEVNLLEYVKR